MFRLEFFFRLVRSDSINRKVWSRSVQWTEFHFCCRREKVLCEQLNAYEWHRVTVKQPTSRIENKTRSFVLLPESSNRKEICQAKGAERFFHYHIFRRMSQPASQLVSCVGGLLLMSCERASFGNILNETRAGNWGTLVHECFQMGERRRETGGSIKISQIYDLRKLSLRIWVSGAAIERNFPGQASPTLNCWSRSLLKLSASLITSLVDGASWWSLLRINLIKSFH